MEDESLRQTIKQFFGVDLPISGGHSKDIDDAIIINTKDSDAGVALEYQILKYIHLLGNKSWKVNEQIVIEKDGRYFDRLSVVLADDPDNLHNYYFDITEFYK